MNPNKAKGYIEMYGPYWRVMMSTPGGGWKRVGKWTGKDGVSDTDLEEGMGHFDQLVELYAGNKSRFQVFAKNSPTTQAQYEDGPFGFFMPSGNDDEEMEAIPPQPSPFGGLSGFNPVEILSLQQETVLRGLSEQRNVMQAERNMYDEYRKKFEELSEEKQQYKLDKALLEKERKDFEAWKKEERATIDEERRKFQDRSEIVRNGTAQALESILGAWAKSGIQADNGLAGLPAGDEHTEPEAPPSPRWVIVENLAQHLYDETQEIDISHLQAIDQFLRKYVRDLKTKLSAQAAEAQRQRQPSPSANEPDPEGEPDTGNQGLFDEGPN